jgi:hypothetical protein
VRAQEEELVMKRGRSNDVLFLLPPVPMLPCIAAAPAGVAISIIVDGTAPKNNKLPSR